MQAVGRALFSLRGACSTAVGRLAGTRALSAAADAEGAAAAPKKNKNIRPTLQEQEGAKSKLFNILGASAEPLTSAQIWEQAEQQGLKSKRFAKQMLQEMRKAGWIKTLPLTGYKKTKVHGFRINHKRQEERQAKLAAPQSKGT